MRKFSIKENPGASQMAKKGRTRVYVFSGRKSFSEGESIKSGFPPPSGNLLKLLLGC